MRKFIKINVLYFRIIWVYNRKYWFTFIGIIKIRNRIIILIKEKIRRERERRKKNIKRIKENIERRIKEVEKR